MRRAVYVLLTTQATDGSVHTGIAGVYWTHLDASQAARALMERFAGNSLLVQIEEREVRGDMPEMRLGKEPA